MPLAHNHPTPPPPPVRAYPWRSVPHPRAPHLPQKSFLWVPHFDPYKRKMRRFHNFFHNIFQSLLREG